MNAYHPSRIQRGFTLIELVIVLAVLGALAAVAVPQLTGLQEEADLAGTATTVSSELGNAFAQELADGNVTNFNGTDCTSLNGSLAPALSSGDGYTLTDSATPNAPAVSVTIPTYSGNTVSSNTCVLQAN